MNLFIKRTIDIIVSFLGLLLLFPFFLIIGIIVKLESEGPVFFTQERRTKDGKIFLMYKFRSMMRNTENMGTGLFNYEDDTRVTGFGRFLRRTSLDELPQLINVLLGDMSLVGPRPCVKYELGEFETLNSRYKKRFSVKAGITGLAQVEGRNHINWDEKVAYDNEYIDAFKKYGILIDIKIFLKTLVNTSISKGIYEIKPDDSIDKVEASRREAEEIIRVAHMPDDN